MPPANSSPLGERRLKAAMQAMLPFLDDPERAPEALAAALAAADAELARAGSEERVEAAAIAIYCEDCGATAEDWQRLTKHQRRDYVVFVRAAMPVLAGPLEVENAKLKRLVNDEIFGDMSCLPTCDSYGHEEGCPATDAAAAFRALRQRLADSERELEFARTMAPPNAFGAHTMEGLLAEAAECKLQLNVTRVRASAAERERDYLADYVDRVIAQRDDARRHLADTKGALFRYGNHRITCAAHVPGGIDCSCGYSAALASSAPAEKGR